MELIIHDDYPNMVCRIYIKEERSGKTILTGYNGEHLIQQVLEDTDKNQNIKPLFVLPLMMKDALIKAFVSEGAKQNLRTENENLLQGKLQATELHLKDMKDLTFQLMGLIRKE
jgi:hypothetical protein